MAGVSERVKRLLGKDAESKRLKEIFRRMNEVAVHGAVATEVVPFSYEAPELFGMVDSVGVYGKRTVHSSYTMQHITQEALGALEILSLEAANKVRIWGFDAPLMNGEQYKSAIAQAAARGAEIAAYVHEAHTLETLSTLPLVSGIQRTSDELPRQCGWRMYSLNRLFYAAVVWDSNRRSKVEPNVWHRTVMIGGFDMFMQPGISELVTLFDKSPCALVPPGAPHIKSDFY